MNSKSNYFWLFIGLFSIILYSIIKHNISDVISIIGYSIGTIIIPLIISLGLYIQLKPIPFIKILGQICLLFVIIMFILNS